MKADLLKKRLVSGEKVLIDGAMGTEILRRGHKTTLPLWSGEVLLHKPEVVREIHEDYIRAGAEVTVTNTFSTTRRVFAKKGIGDKARGATILACKLAQQAREAVKSDHPVYIAGSVAPLEDCYSPELTPPQEELDAEHLEMAQDLKAAGVDFILIETMITLRETLAACRAAKEAELPIAVSFCCKDAEHLLGGERIDAVLKEIEVFDPLFVGVNCVSPEIATDVVKHLHSITNLPISVYAQGDGEPDDDQGWRFKGEGVQQAYVACAKQWLHDGAQLIGGCCGTTPAETTALKALL